MDGNNSGPEYIEVLFVGGPKDRVMMKVEKRPYLQVDTYSGGPTDGIIRIVTYRLERFRGGARDFWMYVEDRLPIEDVISRLIGQYANHHLSAGGR